jgi:hypothetical protein
MTEPWFNPNMYGWIFGTFLGIFGGTMGGLGGFLAPQGKARGLVVGLMIAGLVYSGLCLVAGLIALATGQPWGVWYALVLPGALGLVVIGVNFPVMLMAYRAAEMRKMKAKDLEPEHELL